MVATMRQVACYLRRIHPVRSGGGVSSSSDSFRPLTLQAVGTAAVGAAAQPLPKHLGHTTAIATSSSLSLPLLARHASGAGGGGNGTSFFFGRRQGLVLVMGSYCYTTMTTTTASSSCEGGEDEDILSKLKNMIPGGNGDDDDDEFDMNKKVDQMAKILGKKVEDAIATGLPGQLSYGFVSGFSSGFALKKAGKAGAVIFGGLFCFMQALSYSGYIHVDYDKMNKDFNNVLDFNNDGKVDQDDATHLLDKVMDVVGYNLPAGSGFGTGFIAGIRAG